MVSVIPLANFAGVSEELGAFETKKIFHIGFLLMRNVLGLLIDM